MAKQRARRRPTAAGAAGIRRLLKRDVRWTQTGDALVPYRAAVGTAQWQVRVNDFPDEPMYTLLIDGSDSGSFDDWPASWTRRAENRTRHSEKDTQTRYR